MLPEEINTMYRAVYDKYKKLHEYKDLRRDQFTLMRRELGFNEYTGGPFGYRANLKEQLDYITEQTEEYAKLFNEAMEAKHDFERTLRSAGFCDDIVNSIVNDIRSRVSFLN